MMDFIIFIPLPLALGLLACGAHPFIILGLCACVCVIAIGLRLADWHEIHGGAWVWKIAAWTWPALLPLGGAAYHWLGGR